MKYLITGCAGFIGFHLTDALLGRGYEIVGVDNVNKYCDANLKYDRLAEIECSNNFTFYLADITHEDIMRKIFEKHKFDGVCHLAAQAGVRYSLENPFAYQKSNLEGFQTVIDLTSLFGVRNFVYASSSSVYGGNTKMPFSEDDPVNKPLSLYASTKRSNELTAYTYSHLYRMNCTGLRYFTVYGPYGRPDMALFIFTNAIKRGLPIDVYNYGNMRRSFTYIDDIIDGTVAAIENPMRYELFNLGGGETIELMRYIELIEEFMGEKAEKNMIKLQPGDVVATVADISKAKKMLGYDPKVTVEEGIEKFIEWYQNYYT